MFKLDIRSFIARARQLPIKVTGITINLPFLDITVEPDQLERNVAREIVIRLSDRRVLSPRWAASMSDAFSFYEKVRINPKRIGASFINYIDDDKLKRAYISLQEIRSILVDKQVDLSEKTDGSLYILIAMSLEGIRQYSTFVEELPHTSEGISAAQQALEVLRTHICRLVDQIAIIGDIQPPKYLEGLGSDDSYWRMEDYLPFED